MVQNTILITYIHAMQCKDNETRTKLCKNEKKNPKVTYDNSKFNVNKTKPLRANALSGPIFSTLPVCCMLLLSSPHPKLLLSSPPHKFAFVFFQCPLRDYCIYAYFSPLLNKSTVLKSHTSPHHLTLPSRPQRPKWVSSPTFSFSLLSFALLSN